MAHAAGNTTDKFLKIDEAARIYPIGRNRLRQLVISGEIPHIKLSGRYLVRPERVEDWLNSQEVHGAGNGAETRPD